MKQHNVYVDASVRGGSAAYGIYDRIDQDRCDKGRIFGYEKSTSAELFAILKGLEAVTKFPAVSGEITVIHSDSKYAVNAASGGYVCPGDKLLAARIENILEELEVSGQKTRVSWIRRDGAVGHTLADLAAYSALGSYL